MNALFKQIDALSISAVEELGAIAWGNGITEPILLP